MKETILDILMYLFDNYMDDELAFSQDEAKLSLCLVEAGFQQPDIKKAFTWLSRLTKARMAVTQPAPKGGYPTRIYSDVELEKLNAEARGFILNMEQLGVLQPTTRESVIERVLFLETNEVTLEQLKWVVLMVLFNHSEDKIIVDWFRDLEIKSDDMEDAIH